MRSRRILFTAKTIMKMQPPILTMLPPEAVPPAIPVEHAWRLAPTTHGAAPADVLTSIWRDMREEPRTLITSTPDTRHLIAVSIRAATLSLETGGRTVMKGRIPPGMVQVTGPGESSRMRCNGPCEMLHIYVSRDSLQQCWHDADARRQPACPGFRTNQVIGTGTSNSYAQ